jgi:hypothetical protein
MLGTLQEILVIKINFLQFSTNIFLAMEQYFSPSDQGRKSIKVNQRLAGTVVWHLVGKRRPDSSSWIKNFNFHRDRGVRVWITTSGNNSTI